MLTDDIFRETSVRDKNIGIQIFIEVFINQKWLNPKALRWFTILIRRYDTRKFRFPLLRIIFNSPQIPYKFFLSWILPQNLTISIILYVNISPLFYIRSWPPISRKCLQFYTTRSFPFYVFLFPISHSIHFAVQCWYHSPDKDKLLVCSSCRC